MRTRNLRLRVGLRYTSNLDAANMLYFISRPVEYPNARILNDGGLAQCFHNFISGKLYRTGRTMPTPTPLNTFPTNHVSLPRKGYRLGLLIGIFEDCSAFTRVTTCTLAPPPIRGAISPSASTVSLPPQLLRVLSTWNIRRVGLLPTGKRLCTAYAHIGHIQTVQIKARYSCAI